VNDINALIFTTIGLIMGALPTLFPSHFPPTGADSASTRALWLNVMGAAQIILGVGYLIRTHLVPVTARLLTSLPTAAGDSLALPQARSANGR
jgi:hypothetical protein